MRTAGALYKMDMRRFLGLTAALVSLGGCMVFGPKRAAVRTSILSTTKQVALGNLLYQGDYDDTSPLVDWRPLTFPYIKNNLVYENRRARYPYIFAHRATLIGARMSKVSRPDQVALLFDVEESCDPFLAELPALAFRKTDTSSTGTAFMAFADGHAKAFTSLTRPPIR